MAFLDIDLDAGDPVVREWFLVKSKFWPFFLSISYILVSKYIGVRLMKNREPFELRIVMILYNLFLVISYSSLMLLLFFYLPQVDIVRICQASDLDEGIPTRMITCFWLFYLLKYVEYMDTIFFILRKKNHLLSNLHIIHHTIVPLVGWLALRTERSGFHGIPVVINGGVHILMYSYYTLAACGPIIRKYLWWKKYVTLIQMLQFVLIMFFLVIVLPLSPCHRINSNIKLEAAVNIMMFGLFYNYYYQNFIKKKPVDNSTKTKLENGESNTTVKKED